MNRTNQEPVEKQQNKYQKIAHKNMRASAWLGLSTVKKEQRVIKIKLTSTKQQNNKGQIQFCCFCSRLLNGGSITTADDGDVVVVVGEQMKITAAVQMQNS